MTTPPAHPTGRRRLAWRLALCIMPMIALVQAGCSYPKAIRTYEFLADYDRMTDRFEPLLSLVHMPDGAEFAGHTGVIVGRVDVGGRWVEEPATAQQYATYFSCLLQKRILAIQKFELVTRDTDFAERSGEPRGLLRLDTKITKFDLGCGWKRWASFSLLFFQCGASDIQVEGRVRDVATGALVLEFADRRRHLGNTPWGPNPKTLDSDFVMKVTLDQSAACLAKFIEEAYDGLPSEHASDEGASYARRESH